jgi:site-specific recombinase XerD
MSLYEVSNSLDHVDAQTTQRYTHIRTCRFRSEREKYYGGDAISVIA